MTNKTFSGQLRFVALSSLMLLFAGNGNNLGKERDMWGNE